MNFTSSSRVLIQGMMEPSVSDHIPRMLSYGTQIVAGVSPGHQGKKRYGVSVFDMVEQAIASVGQVDVTMIWMPPYLALDAALEAIAAGIRQIILISEGVPPLDLVCLSRKAEATGTLVIGPNSPGVIVPGQVLLGMHPEELYMPGSVGIISRSGTLLYEVALTLTRAGFGQSIAVGIGSDRLTGSSFQQWLEILNADSRTEVIVLVGEAEGTGEEKAAHYIIVEAIGKPVVAYIAGRTHFSSSAIDHLRLSHPFSEIDSHMGIVDRKVAAFKQAKIPIADRPSQIPDLMKKVLHQVRKG
jgi:succinyl-CoA synthetase alpha subunit